MGVNWRSRIIGHGEEAPDQLLANPANWRIHPKAQQDALAGVLGEIGWVQSVIVNKRTGHLVDGHLRVSLALRDDAKTIPVVYVDLSPDEEALVLATIDPLAAMAVTDGAELSELLTVAGTNNPDVQSLLESLSVQATKALGKLESSDQEVPPPPARPRSKSGDVWLLGRHRLLVGDATIADDWKRLMNGQSFDLMWTDPPYGVEYEGGTEDRLTIQNDGLATLEQLLTSAFEQADKCGKPGAAVYVAHPPGPNSAYFEVAFLAQGWRWHERLIWVKDSLVLGHSDYHLRHEPILFGYTKGGGRRGRGGAGWYGGNAETSVLEFDRPKSNREHPTMKPIPLVAYCIQNSAPINGIVADPFAGSGTTLLAAEQTGRIGYGIEIDPKYADVICRRFETMTGTKPILESTKVETSFLDQSAR
jgi:DNA modification methylase